MHLLSDTGLAGGDQKGGHFAQRLEFLLPDADVLEELHFLVFDQVEMGLGSVEPVLYDGTLRVPSFPVSEDLFEDALGAAQSRRQDPPALAGAVDELVDLVHLQLRVPFQLFGNLHPTTFISNVRLTFRIALNIHYFLLF